MHFNNKYIFAAGTKTVKDHFNRQKIDVKVESMSGKPGFYKVQYPSTKYSIVIGQVIPNRQPAAARWVEKLMSTQDYNDCEIIIGSWYLKYASKSKKIDATIIPDTESDYMMAALGQAIYSVVVVCNHAIVPKVSTMIGELASVANATDSLVQPLLVGPDGTIIDAGFVDSNYGIQPLFKDMKIGDNTFFGDVEWVRDIRQVSGLVYAVNKNHITQRHSKKSLSRIHISTDIKSILWAHSVFKYVGPLDYNVPLPTFNPLLSQLMYEISMSNSGWDQQMELVDE